MNISQWHKICRTITRSLSPLFKQFRPMRSVAFSSSSGGREKGWLFLKATRPTVPEVPVTVAGLTFDAMEPFLSPDGITLFFNSLNAGGNTNLYQAENDTMVHSVVW